MPAVAQYLERSQKVFATNASLNFNSFFQKIRVVVNLNFHTNRVFQNVKIYYEAEIFLLVMCVRLLKFLRNCSTYQHNSLRFMT